MSTEVELNLRLDKDCRTTFDPSSVQGVINNNAECASEASSSSIDYSSKTVLTSLADEAKIEIFLSSSSSPPVPPPSAPATRTSKATTTTPSVNSNCGRKQKLLDDLLFDCEITDCALLPRTFWMPCTGRPRCALEQCALEVFYHHVRQRSCDDGGAIPAATNISYDPSTSGAEWWVQVR